MCQSAKNGHPLSPSTTRTGFFSRTTVMTTMCLVFCLPPLANAQKKKTPEKTNATLKETPKKVQLETAIKARDYATIIKMTEGETDPKSRLGGVRAQSLQERGQLRFFASLIDKSIEDFDAYLKFYPDRDPHHWQRGIAYYYAEKFDEGKSQFERHQKVNARDVENAVWHFLCSARSAGGSVEDARKELIPIEGDNRVPMQQIYALFAGDGTVEDVLDVCESRNDNYYAHLYIGLYFEALGEPVKAKTHIELCANDFRMDHYMGRVGQVHAKQRGWTLRPQ